jgi:uncharacterized coiled-coil protein SlyX
MTPEPAMLAMKERPEMEDRTERLESRVARLEIHFEHMSTDIAEIKSDQRALIEKVDAINNSLNGKIDAVNGSLSGKIDALNDSLNEKYVSLVEKLGELKVWALVFIGCGVLSVLARALHWI